MEHGTQVHFSTVHEQPQQPHQPHQPHQHHSNTSQDLDSLADHVIDEHEEEQEQEQEQEQEPRSINKSKSNGPSTPNSGTPGTFTTFSPGAPARWLSGLMGTRNANTNTFDQGDELGDEFKKKTSVGGARNPLSRSSSQKKIDWVRSPPLRDASGNVVVAQPDTGHGAATEAKSLGISLEAKSFHALLSPNTKKKRTQVNSADHFESPAPQPHNPLASAAPAIPTKPGSSSSKKNLAKDIGNEANTNAGMAAAPALSTRLVNLTSKRSLKDVTAGFDEQQRDQQQPPTPVPLLGERDYLANSTSFGRSKSEKNLGERTASMKKGLEKLISNLGVTMDNGEENYVSVDDDQFVIEPSPDFVEKKHSMGKRSSSINIPSKKHSGLNMTTNDFQHNLSKRASSMHLTIDQTYEMKEQIGRGGQSLIFAAIRLKDGKKVAIKRISKLKKPEETEKDLAKRMEYARIEAEVWATVCDHKNIVELLDLMEDEEHIYMVMEYIDGKQMLQSVSTLQFNEVEALIILRQVAAAVAHLHSYNIAHRDVKFENIMFTSVNPSSNSFDLKLIDFGLVHSATHRKTEESSATAGTFMWMSPEQISAIPHPAMSVDIWSMGVLLFTLVEMRYPFYAKTMEELEANICKVSLTKEIHKATPDVKALLLDMLTHDFNNRPKADEIVSRVDKMLAARNVKIKFEMVKSKKGGGLLGGMF